MKLRMKRMMRKKPTPVKKTEKRMMKRAGRKKMTMHQMKSPGSQTITKKLKN